MRLWKQASISFAVLIAAFVLWAAAFPAAPEMAGRFGLKGPATAIQSLFRSQVDAAPTPGTAPATTAGAAKTGAAPGKTAQAQGTGAGGASRGRGPTLVVTQAAGTAVLDDRVAALGVGRALQAADLVPQAAGQVVELPVAAGARVAAGTLIARLDDAAERIARDKAAVALDDATRTLDHVRQLAAGGTATPTQLQAAQLAADLARLSLDQARHDLDQRQILAPFAGRLGLVSVNAGAQVTAQTVIARLEDDQRLIVRFTLPERLVGRIRVGDTVGMTPTARPDLALQAQVTAIDTAVDAASGTFQAEAALDNAAGDLIPGMTFDVTLRSVGQTAVTVNPLAIQWGAQGAYVWKLTPDSTVTRASVTILQRNADAVLVSGAVAEGDPVVTEGLDGLREGASVQDVNAAPKDAPQGAAKTGGG